MSSLRWRLFVSLTALSILLLGGSPARAQSAGVLGQDAAHCQQQVGKGGQKFKKAALKAWQKCLDGLLTGKACDAIARDSAIAAAADRYVAASGKECTAALLFGAPPPEGVGFSPNCDLKVGPVSAAEAQCRPLNVTDPASLTRCLICWKETQLRELLQTLYPCLASQVPAGSDLDCGGTPPASCPTDEAGIICSRAIAKTGITFFLAKEKALEQCLDGIRKGKISRPCPDSLAQRRIAAAERRKMAQMGKCTQAPPWWDVCPEDPTPPCDQTITSVTDIGACVDGAAEEIADEVVCQQYPGAAADGIACPTETQSCSTFSFLAQWGSGPFPDGQFNAPHGVALDGSGNVFVADSGNNRIQKFTNTGTPLAKWGGQGSGDGEFNGPSGIAVDGSGNVFVADSGNNRIQKFTNTGTFLAKWGSQGIGDGQFRNPLGVAVDGSGNVFVADVSNQRIQKFTNTGTFLTKWGDYGSIDGRFGYPVGVAVDGEGNVFVADSGNNRVQKFTNAGTFLTKWGSQGGGDGQFAFPSAVAVDGSGNVFVADSGNRIQKFTNAGTFLTTWGSQGSGDGQFNGPNGVAVDGSGNVFIADSSNQRIQKFTNTGTFLTTWGTYGPGQFSPSGVAVDESGSVFVADPGNHRIQKFTNTGTFLATWGSAGSGDGQFNGLSGVAVDGSGNVFVVDAGNQRVQKFTSTGTFLATWGSAGSGDGQFEVPSGVAVDGSGNVFVVDAGNHRIQKFTSIGTFLATWGSEGSGDGQFEVPTGVAVDGVGNVFVPDFVASYVFDHGYRIQKFTNTGTFLTAWGRDGDGQRPSGIAVDRTGNAYVAEYLYSFDSGSSQSRITKFTDTGTVLTTWGSLGSGPGQFDAPSGVAVDASGNVYVGDSGNHRIQKFGCP